jgi:hypothetical protein
LLSLGEVHGYCSDFDVFDNGVQVVAE